MFRLNYSATLVQTDNFGNPIGPSYTFQGAQFIANNNPQTADLNTAASAMGTDIAAKLVGPGGYQVQAADDSSADGSGGQG